jgi:hypothetical protein
VMAEKCGRKYRARKIQQFPCRRERTNRIYTSLLA